jgi:D-alanyl-D-alanine carboxypeptidase (penicillin-binding protein 5/6)
MRARMRTALAFVFVAALPVPAGSAQATVTDRFPGVAAAYAVAIDGKLAWASNPDTPRQPASLAKLLTALVLLDSDWKPDAEVRISPAAARIEGSRIGLKSGEVLRAADLLTGMLVRSGNDACLALVEDATGSIGSFAARMNQRATAIGMKSSHFVHPCGLDAPGQHSTARDLLILGATARQQQEITRRSAAAAATVRTQGGRELRFHNSNALIGRQPDTSGLKSGYTSQAGNCLIATADRDGHQVLLVLLGAPDRWWEAAGIIARGLAVAAPGPRLD